MSKTLVAVVDTVFPTLDPARDVLAKVDAELVMAEQPTPDSILSVASEADAVLVTYGQITSEVIDGLKNCKVIGRFGIGIDNIDIPAATAKGIIVVYAPVYCLEEVSDHAMALMLSLARKITFSNNLVSDGRWEMPAVVPIARLKGRTLGLIGLGNIPQNIVGKAQAFGMEVAAADPYCPDDVFNKLNVKKIDLVELLSDSDFVSIHAPLTEETEGMFNAGAFKKMKSSAFLINTARGPLVNMDDLAVALENGEIAGAGLDVYDKEPLPQDHKLRFLPNALLLPHIGYVTAENYSKFYSQMIENLEGCLENKPLRLIS